MEKHKQKVRLDPNNWIGKHVLCQCTSCDVTLSSVKLEEHLVNIHSFPIKKSTNVTEKCENFPSTKYRTSYNIIDKISKRYWCPVEIGAVTNSSVSNV